MAFYQTPGTDFHDLNLDWLLNQMKQCLTEWASVREDWDELRTDTNAFMAAIQEDWNTVKAYIENYFTNLNVQDEINAKINAMVESGEFSQIIGATVQSVTATTTTDWLERNISQETGYAVDSGLTTAGAAADAKAVGDITHLLGVQINAFQNTLYNQESVSLSSSTNNKAWGVSDGVVSLIDGTGWRAVNEKTVTAGELYQITASQGNTEQTRIWYLTDSSNNLVASAPNFITTTHEKKTDVFVVPAGATKLLITYDNASGVTAPKASLTRLTGNNFANQGDLQTLSITALTSCTKYGVYRSGALYLSNVTDLPANYNTSDSFNLIIIYPAYASAAFIMQILISVTGRIWIRTLQLSQGAWSALNDWAYITRYDEKPFTGKYFSLMGDSISSYDGYVPEGNATYYPTSNVNNVNQMWWYIMCDVLGMTPLVINAWSGSAVTQLTDTDHASITPMSATTRCANLGTDVHDPDVIVIMGGTNDYTYAAGTANEPGTWDVSQAPVEGTNFIQTYAAMVKKIQTNYPNAIIVACSTIFTTRGTDIGYTYTHTVGDNVYTQCDYDAAIKTVCDEMRIPYIDMCDIGFNRTNQSTYTIDGTHAKRLGQKVMGLSMAARIVPLIKGYLDQ